MKSKEIRTEKGSIQRQVADYIGCTPSVYSRYETGDREPSIDTLIQLSRCLGATIDRIVGNDAPEDKGLNSYEAALVNAARNADDRAREDALNMLLAHKADTKKMPWHNAPKQCHSR